MIAVKQPIKIAGTAPTDGQADIGPECSEDCANRLDRVPLGVPVLDFRHRGARQPAPRGKIPLTPTASLSQHSEPTSQSGVIHVEMMIAGSYRRLISGLSSAASSDVNEDGLRRGPAARLRPMSM
ncbi:MAG: hypothetical protein M3Y40_04950, partial [Chloroflexota bacterium]|nr:hypothetical protein [Chloroflexota bacterium]